MEEEEDDAEICSTNLQFALQIYVAEKENIEQGKPSKMKMDEVNYEIMKVRSRLGDLYTLNEKFRDGIEEYQQVVKL